MLVQVVFSPSKELTPDQAAAWSQLAVLIHTLPAAFDGQLLRDSQLTNYEFGVLVCLKLAGDDGLRMTELAFLSSGQLNRLSQVARRMEKRGLISRAPDPEDRRAIRVGLTPSGHEVLDDAAPDHFANVRRVIFDHLSDEQVVQLADIGRTIAEANGWLAESVVDTRDFEAGSRSSSTR